jgi:mRNA interferase MazF
MAEMIEVTQIAGESMVVNQGDIYWARSGEPGGLESDYAHPYVIIQDDVINRSRINTVVVCALTTNLRRAKAPGNVLLQAGEANLPRQSIVMVSLVSTVDKSQLGEYIGSLNEQRIHQILAGMQFLQRMSGHRETGERK